MEMRRWWWTWIVAMAAMLQVAKSDPQTNNLGNGCSSTVAKSVSDFNKNLNATFSDLRSQLSHDKWFATAQPSISSEPVYGMVQCRNYMSQLDCLACYDAAVTEIRENCISKNVTGGRSVFDGCFLRYEAYEFYKRTSEHWLTCSNVSVSENAMVFTEEGKRLLNDLQLATPQANSFFAASKRNLGSTTIYGVAQCAQTVSQEGCQGCLMVANESLSGCLAATEGRVVDAGCFMRYSNSSFFPDNQTTDIQSLLQARTNGSSVNEKALIGGTVGGAGLVVIVVTIFMWYKFSTRLKNALIVNILGATELQSPNRYSYKDLKEATNNFSEENKLGQGGFGSVYKATLRNGTVVAVKKLDMSYSRAKEDFESEVRLISNVHHRNLVRLLGCCSKRSELLLVYEYMEHGSLDTFLYGKRRGTLTWKQRYDIIFGTARGIAYLHENYYETILHRDIKPSNILLDTRLQPKIADFGLARLQPENKTHVSTQFAGTLGYTAPEYARFGHLSEKTDIYSFGIVILEIISGRKCTEMNYTDSTTDYLLNEAWKQYERGMHESLADEALKSKEYEVEELKKMVEIGMLCVQSAPSLRPTMSELIMMISTDGSMQRPRASRRPSFSYENDENRSVSEEKSAASDATTSISNTAPLLHGL